MSIKEQEKPQNFGQLINKGTSISVKDIVKGKDDAIVKMESLENAQYEIVDLPSRGWTYPEDSVLSSGRIKLKLPTGRNQAILSSQNLIKKGIMIDEFLRSLILEDFQLQDLLIGDKNYITFASRRLAYGNQYQVQIECPKCGTSEKIKVDLSKLELKDCSKLFEYPKTTNQFQFILPDTKRKVLFILNNGHTQKTAEKRIKAEKNPQLELTIKTAVLVKQFDGETQYGKILKSVQEMSAKEHVALRKHMRSLMPDIILSIQHECGNCFRSQEVFIPLTVQFFWPSIG